MKTVKSLKGIWLSTVSLLVLFFAALLTSCNKEKPITLDVYSVRLHHGETYKIPAECENPISYSSEIEYYASVTQDGVVTANHVGGTAIHLESKDDKRDFVVYVIAKSGLYSDPNIGFGQFKSSLSTPDYQTSTTYCYFNYAPHVPYLLVTFDALDRVKAYAVLVDYNQFSELMTYLNERYECIGIDGVGADRIWYYIDGKTSAEAKRAIVATSYQYEGLFYWMVTYMPNPTKDERTALCVDEGLIQFIANRQE